jgi:hypothetical protein
MAFTGSTTDLLRSLEEAIGAGLDEGWAAEPPAARAALLAREALERWTRATYPGAALEGRALEPDSRRRLSLAIHSAPVTHRVEIWGLACGDAQEGVVSSDAHVAHSWVLLVHLGPPCPRLAGGERRLAELGLRRVDARQGERITLTLWMGAAAPDGCAACRADAPGHP